jgi:tetratricopeptide (TPR) repeat protein
LKEQGRLEQAIAEYRKALQLNPNDPAFYYSLGNVLRETEHLDEAIAAYHKAIELDPNCANAYCNLGFALQRRGQFAEALASLRRGHEQGSKQPGWTSPSAQWVRDAERLVELEPKLKAVLQGEGRPANEKERLELANLCGLKQHPADAARLFAEAFAADPQLVEDLKAFHRYNGACYAALAGCGRGEDAAKLDDQEKARLRRQALDWLKADLASRTQQLTGEKRQEARTLLQHWKNHPDLSGVRGEALSKLPEAERAAWKELWGEVDALLSKGSTPEKKP